ncbi:universal stress protein [Lysinibacillus sp. 3P01SB]|uniref:universal stress protein n=1 Tax=Lysinibacillus sp. 3P01SB TaxID=3132284 RepID=UPI0039A6BF69
MYKHIIVAVDGSDNSLRAMEDAIKIASAGSQIEVLYIASTEHIASKILEAGTLDEFNAESRKRVAREEEVLKVSGIPYKVIIEHGEPGKTIAKFVNDSKADLVVIGCRGLTSMQEMVFGSVSSYVMKNVDCSCLLVK